MSKQGYPVLVEDESTQFISHNINPLTNFSEHYLPQNLPLIHRVCSRYSPAKKRPPLGDERSLGEKTPKGIRIFRRLKRTSKTYRIQVLFVILDNEMRVDLR